MTIGFIPVPAAGAVNAHLSGCLHRIVRRRDQPRQQPHKATAIRALDIAQENGVSSSNHQRTATTTNTLDFPSPHRLLTVNSAPQLALRYGFPVVTQPADNYVAIIELITPGGSGWSKDDFKTYCEQLEIPVPPMHELSVRGAKNTFTGNAAGSADVEFALDMQVIAGATLGTVQLLMIYAPGDKFGIKDALQAVLNFEDVDKVSAVSLSWGFSEAQAGEELAQACDKVLQALLDKGITVFAASGDDSARDQDPDSNKGLNADYPAASPYAFGCGATTITNNDIITEKAWSSGGGGVSMFSPVPKWQVDAAKGVDGSQGMRCVPDGAMVGDPQSGYSVICAGRQMVLGGTSAVAPMWAAWKGLTDAVAGKRLPFSAEAVYTGPAACLTDITTGNNGTYNAQIGYDLCTGMGVPNAEFTAAWLRMNGVTWSPSTQPAVVS
ncbi:g4183 [Coccomyxa viridis]|uniref:G4183 protein n=1 Tax=Coccomyxa viridis TaxID=1274662 RepID=A0ABP1FPN9_9CHLO